MFGFFSLLLLCTSTLFAGQEQIARINAIDVWYETFGKKEIGASTIMGGCCQGVLWPVFCERLAHEGFYVIRYDHRDAGLSTCVDFEENPYDLMDMAKDAVGILDAANIEKAHLFGVSLGAFLAEIMAGYFPERVHSILLMGSSCDIRPMNLAYAGLPPKRMPFSLPLLPNILLL